MVYWQLNDSCSIHPNSSLLLLLHHDGFFHHLFLTYVLTSDYKISVKVRINSIESLSFISLIKNYFQLIFSICIKLKNI